MENKNLKKTSIKNIIFSKSTIAIFSLSAIVISFSIYFIWFKPAHDVKYCKLRNSKIENGKRVFINEHETYEKYHEIINKKKITNATIIGGFGGLILIVIQIIRTYKFSNQVKEERRSNINSETLDQYVKAVDQLKDRNIAVRLGGIYSLEKIMNSKDKEVQDYHDTIIELLCAYLREKRKFNESLSGDKINQNNKVLGSDIQAVLTIIGRRENIEIEKIEIDLISTDLFLVNLNFANLENANLFNTNLKKAKLVNARLNSAKLNNAHLQYANLENANLENANMLGSNLRFAVLTNANLIKSNLEFSNLKYAKLENANLSNAMLCDSDLEYAYLYKTNLENTVLWSSNLKNANLKFAYLINADLEDANLEKTIFENANLTNANLMYIRLNSDIVYRDNNMNEIVDFINELKKAKQVKGIQLDDNILEIIKNEFHGFYRRINGELTDDKIKRVEG